MVRGRAGAVAQPLRAGRGLAATAGGLHGRGRVLVATGDAQIVAYLQLVESDVAHEVELQSVAVVEHAQRKGIGRALVARAIAKCREEGDRTLHVATASADTGNPRFYQRLGFRMPRVERDALTVADGYPDELALDGIPLRDRVWLTLALDQTT